MASGATGQSIKVMHDTVLKLSIMQGTEEQRQDANINNFTSGELAYTRDSGRVFVGDNSDGVSFNNEEQPDIQANLQQTKGGSLVGNKYIGLIDSRPLATFEDNSSALSYEKQTHETSDSRSAAEQALLYEDSKFRDPYLNEIGEAVTNWDRKSTYNKKLNAYTGDYFFDVYKNALILVDHRIAPFDNKKDTALYEDAWIPEFVMEDGLYKSPQTFIENGKQIPATIDNVTNPEALEVRMRTPIKNYAHTNNNFTNHNDIYGEGYVMIRIVEPDNQTIRFKARTFDMGGTPLDGDSNFNHNLLEVFYVPLCAFYMHFNDDFAINGTPISKLEDGACKNGQLELHKEIENVKSITSENASLKVPNSLTFSHRDTKSGRGSIGEMQWNFTAPASYIPGAAYTIQLVPKSQKVTDPKDGSEHAEFDMQWEKVEPPPIQDYYINLKGGLMVANQTASPYLLRLNDAATNPLTAPTLTFSIDQANDGPLVDNESDPLSVGYGGYTVYSSNFGVTPQGQIKTIDVYEDAYYQAAADRIQLFEEQNTSLNLLKKPVTIMSTSKNPRLYSQLNGGIYDGTQTVTVTTKATLAASDASATAIKNDPKTLANLISSAGTIKYATNKGSTAGYNNVKMSGQKITIPNSATNNGTCVVISSGALTNNREIGKVFVSATISNLTNTSNTNKFTGFLGLKNGANLIKLESFEQYYSNFSFTFSLDASEVLVSGSTYIIFGIICDNFGTSFDITLDKIYVTYRDMTNNEQKFEVARHGINAYVDFCAEPYLYCFRKVVTTPDKNMLPVATATNWPGKVNSGYFNNFANNASYVKTWNNLAWVLGHNHYLNNNINDSNVPVISRSNMKYTGADTITKKVFKHLRGIEIDPASYAKVIHNKIDDTSNNSIIFSWYAEYQKSGSTRTNVTYFVNKTSDIRDANDIYDWGDDISYIYLGESTTNLINIADTNDNIIKGEEQDYGDGWYAMQYAIMSESSLLDGDISYIRYGRSTPNRQWKYQDESGQWIIKTIPSDTWNAVNDLFKTAGLTYEYELIGFSQYGDGHYEEDSVQKIVLHNGQKTGALEITGTTLNNLLKSGFNIDTTISGQKISSYQFLTIFYNDPLVSDSEDFTLTYMIVDGNYVAGMYEPRANVGTGSIVKASDGSLLTDRTINESIPNEYKVYIPKHARSILLEMTHITSTNNMIGVSYSNEFSNLGIMLSGQPSQEYDGNAATYTNELRMNPWYDYPNEPEAGYTDNGTIQIPKSKSEVATSAFHDTTKLPSNTQKPSAYSTAKNEKMLCLSSQTETKIIEVPFQKSNQTGVRHFALRLTNLRPATAESVNYFCLKVIGYRV